jgi:hypothetical protein
MSSTDLALIDAKTAREVCGRAPVGDEARALLAADMAPRRFLELLIEQRLHLYALRFLAYAMVKRAAVWWAYRCVADALGGEPPAPVARALDAVKAWATDPTDDNRRACWPAAEAAEIGSPAGCTSMAAFLSGGSLAPPNLTAVPPAEDLTARMVIGALTLTAVSKEPEKAAPKHAAFVRTGMEIADGQNLWPMPTRTPPPPSRPPLKNKKR